MWTVSLLFAALVGLCVYLYRMGVKDANKQNELDALREAERIEALAKSTCEHIDSTVADTRRRVAEWMRENYKAGPINIPNIPLPRDSGPSKKSDGAQKH